ncbi:RNA polymerase recycling motor ATPase HelR [Phycicoccus sp. M110.8]|uniref:RNA polymerase recycling motor ATPase HelR n=1 Tax=Phycicoccus sp. M110.8 TaxID=3075433 RepID=UPI0028FD8AA2|nr:RNA polymerase recycling motor ATPase HelR [Phycicoccus sp. M110.8]MDU0315405.1 RNA polymerase recycling motor ATPase HelR [Phycicoccus sp. M110.8]
MTSPTTSAFALPERFAAKGDPTLIADDERHFRDIGLTLEETLASLSRRLEEQRRAPVRAGQEALERDLEVHRLGGRLRALRRFGLDLCLGHVVRAGDPEPVYVGRLGLRDDDGRQLLHDWRSPAAEAFFGATHSNPMGLVSRRRYRWTGGRVSDYWDEVFTAEGLQGHAASLDDQSAFVASLGSTRSPRMRDVLGTIQADQDAIIRAGSRGALVVDGGPGTGKTVVALHRTAYLLYSDPRLGHRRGGVLFVGPHEPYLAYVADVLPSLGEEGVQTCTLRDLVPEGATALPETDAEVARLKASARLVTAVEAAVRFYEEAPTEPLDVSTPWGEVRLDAEDWATVLDAPAPGTPHNEARDDLWDELATVVAERLEADTGGAGDGDEVDEVDERLLARTLRSDEQLRAAVERAWPLLEPTDLVGDLWTVPAFLRLCAPWLTSEEVRSLQRAVPDAWTDADLPFLDAARRRLGDPRASRERRRREAVQAAEREEMSRVVDDLIASDDSEMHVMSMLRGQDLQTALVDEASVPTADPDLLAGPFAHVVVDEAQELTDAQWQMLLGRCPSRSLTVVGDRAQARHGFHESWQERLGRIGLDGARLAHLGVNYRTPQEVMAEAEPVIRAALPDANVPTSVRASGRPVVHGRVADLPGVVDAWLVEHAEGEGVACVIGDPSFAGTARVRSLTPQLAKGLEFDLVVLVEPESFGDGIEGAVDRYVAMTRATQQLVVLAG